MLDFSKAKDWIITETNFDPYALGKVEANFCLGNGYLGLRSATEERYVGETRDLLIAGTFDRFAENEVTELPNAADVTNIEMTLNGERFDLTCGSIISYERSLNLKTGLLTRNVTWNSPKGNSYKLKFERIVSLKRLHTMAMRISITAKQDISVKFCSGIDGRMTSDGSQHFTDGEVRFYDKKYQQYVPRTIQSGITFVLDAVHRITVDGKEASVSSDIYISRRHMFSNFNLNLSAGQTVVLEKFANVFTSRDLETEKMTVPEIQEFALDRLKEDEAAGFNQLAEESAATWMERVWNRAPISIEGSDYDEMAIHFAQYQMQLMTPAHDNRMNIGAKGLSGEGYKGHCFWDTEIFLLPYFIFTMPETARKLEEYRYLSLPGAHAKAKHNGYEGAQFPWESAWLDDGEVTPEYMGTDIVSGKPLKVWSGFIEIHITSDVAFGAWQYYMCTGDQDFMDRYGYELIFDCAKFWSSRLEKGDDGKLHLNDVVGPDEYKEHVNDNAFTNYMARWTILKAVEYANELKAEKPELFAALDEKLGVTKLLPNWMDEAETIYLTQPNENGVLPQDSTYLTLKDIDLTKYKKQAHVGGIAKDYNNDQISKMQVSKQADVMVLFILLEEIFSQKVKLASWNYYEPRTLHDSSLSLSTHSVLACDIGDTELGYQMFQKACNIDLGNDDPHSSDAGIHAASCGGLWQCIVYGFGGVRMLGGNLRINPKLPEAWTALNYTILWKGQRLAVSIKKEAAKCETCVASGTAGAINAEAGAVSVTVENETGTAPIELELCGKKVVLEKELTVNN